MIKKILNQIKNMKLYCVRLMQSMQRTMHTAIPDSLKRTDYPVEKC